MESTIAVPSRYSATPWPAIVNGAPRWFSKSTVRWWQCRIHWSTLTPIGAGNFLFISSDSDLSDGRRYAVREYNPTFGTVETPASWLETRADAVKVLKQLLADEQAVSGIEQAKLGQWWNL